MSTFASLPAELHYQVFDSLETIQDVLALSSTCHGLRKLYTSTRQLPMLVAAAERQHGPFEDAARLVTHSPSRPPLAPRAGAAAPSLALVAQVHRVGAVANRWADVYPVKKWHANYLDRRELTRAERARLRRAVYRLWLFAAAFNSPDAAPARYGAAAAGGEARAAFMRRWTTVELLEMADVRCVMRDAIAQNVCPSNAAVARKYLARHEGDPDAGGGLVFNLGSLSSGGGYGGSSSFFDPPRAIAGRGKAWVGGLPTPPSDDDHDDGAFYSSATHRAQQRHETWAASLRRGGGAGAEAGAEGWGDGAAHERAVAAVLKLDPGAILWLKERKMRRADVLRWLGELGGGGGGGGGWFDRCRDTCGEALEQVLAERRVGDVEEALEMGAGVVAADDDELGEDGDDEGEDDE
jgi:hypothetical protein